MPRTASDLYAKDTELTFLTQINPKHYLKDYDDCRVQSVKCLQTLHLPSYVLCIITPVNRYCAQLLLGIITNVRGGIGLFCTKVICPSQTKYKYKTRKM